MFDITDNEDRVPEILFDGKVHVWHIGKACHFVEMGTDKCPRGYGFIVKDENRPTDAVSLKDVSFVLVEQDGPYGKWLTVRYTKYRNTTDSHNAMFIYFPQHECADIGYLYYKRNVNA